MLVTTPAKLDGVHWPVETLGIHGNYIKSYFFLSPCKCLILAQLLPTPLLLLFLLRRLSWAARSFALIL